MEVKKPRMRQPFPPVKHISSMGSLKTVPPPNDFGPNSTPIRAPPELTCTRRRVVASQVRLETWAVPPERG
eukprot:scaffold3082_cov119-Isochrysis_galbana.AAC.3